jgi:4-hydroxy-tetrahydrodipicolinate reductase
MSDSPALRVAVSGARGKVGREIVAALHADPGFACVAEVDVDDDLTGAIVDFGAQLLIDFTTPAAGLRNALIAVEAGVAPIVGTTGLGAAGVDRIREACGRAGTGGCVAANFALGAALLMWFSELGAPHFEHAEIIETHNPAKADAPSGTALRTAERMLAARAGRAFAHRDAQTAPLAGTRGGTLGGIGVHSLRLDGVVADQAVVLGALGQTLTLSHRTTSRAAFAPGVLLAARKVAETHRFFDSLEAVLGLPDPATVYAAGTQPLP